MALVYEWRQWCLMCGWDRDVPASPGDPPPLRQPCPRCRSCNVFVELHGTRLTEDPLDWTPRPRGRPPKHTPGRCRCQDCGRPQRTPNPVHAPAEPLWRATCRGCGARSVGPQREPPPRTCWHCARPLPAAVAVA